MKNLSLTARISLLFAMSASAVLLATGFFLSRAVEMHFVESDRHELDGKLELIRHLVERVSDSADHERLPRQLDDALVGHHGLAVALTDHEGAVWYITRGAHIPEVVLAGLDCPGDLAGVVCLPGGLWQWRQGGHDFRGKVLAMTTERGEMYHVAVAQDIAHHVVFMNHFQLTLALAMTLAALATASLGWFATHRGLGALRRFSDLAAGISAEHLTTRLPEEGNPPELGNLAQSFNAMLARLDDSFRRLSEFSSDIAHELRTPISNLMTQTQVALSRGRSIEEYRGVLESSVEEYERLARMTDEMLFLAKADNRLLALSKEQVDLAREARDLIEFHGIVAEERGIQINLEGKASVHGDRLMLRRALSNLIANAIRHTLPRETVNIRLVTTSEVAVVQVENPGAIPAENLPHLFDRFYTGDPSRRSGSGTGLGLAIVRSIVELNGGTVTASSRDGRIVFEMCFPVGEG